MVVMIGCQGEGFEPRGPTNDKLSYEENQEGELVLVRSIESTQRAFLRFTNTTKRPVNVWWRDFEGVACHYARLQPDSIYDVNTFVTHPWEVTDAATKEPYWINNKEIFRVPENLGGMMFRTNWNITIRMRTLRETALLAIAETIPYPELALELEIPRDLQYELQDIIEKVHYSEILAGE